MFFSRALQFAKTAVKETASKKKPVPGAAKQVKTTNIRDPSKPPLPLRFSLPQIISFIPPPPPASERSEWQHKNGWGLKFYRAAWAKYPEPCYWTVTRFKPSTHGHKCKVWGVLTWRGVTEQAPREITGCRKREWKYLQEDNFAIPFPASRPKTDATGSDSAAEAAEPLQQQAAHT